VGSKSANVFSIYFRINSSKKESRQKKQLEEKP